MRWVDLLFAHWPVPVEALRPLDPVGARDRHVRGAGVARRRARSGWRTSRRGSCPRHPGRAPSPSSTSGPYVTRGGRGGVWFLSLDAGSRLAVGGGPGRASTCRTTGHACRREHRCAGWVDVPLVERRGPRAVAAAQSSTARYRPTGPVEPWRRPDRWRRSSPTGFGSATPRIRTGRILMDGRSGTHPGRSRTAPRPRSTRTTMASASRARAAGRVAPLLHFAKRLRRPARGGRDAVRVTQRIRRGQPATARRACIRGTSS